MNTFVNGFRCVAKNDGNEFVLHLTQTYPVFNEADNTVSNGTETVGSFVMSPDEARHLADAIYKTLPDAPDVQG